MTGIAIDEPAAELATLADLPFHTLGRHPKALLVGRVQDGGVTGVSTRDWFDRVRDVALGLEALGIAPGDRVAIVSESRPEWITVDLAVLLLGAVTVPVYPTLAPPQAAAILADSGARFAFASTPELAARLEAVRSQMPSLERIIVFDAPGEGGALTLDEVAARGHARMIAEWGIARQMRDRARAVQPEQLATIIYTSGTTGEPKGVMLSHRNLVSNLFAAHAVVPVNSDDTILSYLPLSHSFERLASYFCLAAGVTIVFAESIETIGRDLVTVRPTVMTGVPRVYEKFQQRIVDGGRSLPFPRRVLFDWGVRVATARGRAQASDGRPSGAIALQTAIAERLVFSKIRERVGGRLRILVSGSAPLPKPVAEFFFGVGLPITEGYGLTETSPVLTANPPAAARPGTVGRTIPGVELRIADDGEILARGPNVMMGYYNRPAETAAVMEGDWFHTGDVGSLDADGYLTITDRKKDLIVTSGGKKVAPQPIEERLKRDPLVAEAIVLGDRHKFISALIVPNFQALEARLRAEGKRVPDREALVSTLEAIAVYEAIVARVNESLSRFEQVKKIRLLPRELTIDSGELTPTMKVKRRVVEQRWAREIDEMYG
ncbi:MAG: AMP-dependent synthetase/ligase [Vicinamibacterales bacterium]